MPEAIDTEALLTQGSKLAVDGQVFFEDLDFTARADNILVQQWAELLARAIFPETLNGRASSRSALLLYRITASTSCQRMELRWPPILKLRTKKKIVANGALWYEEALSVGAILAGIVWCDRVYGCNGDDQKKIAEKIFSTFCGDSLPDLQIGGKATVGKGRVRCRFTGA